MLLTRYISVAFLVALHMPEPGVTYLKMPGCSVSSQWGHVLRKRELVPCLPFTCHLPPSLPPPLYLFISSEVCFELLGACCIILCPGCVDSPRNFWGSWWTPRRPWQMPCHWRAWPVVILSHESCLSWQTRLQQLQLSSPS